MILSLFPFQKGMVKNFFHRNTKLIYNPYYYFSNNRYIQIKTLDEAKEYFNKGELYLKTTIEVPSLDINSSSVKPITFIKYDSESSFSSEIGYMGLNKGTSNMVMVGIETSATDTGVFLNSKNGPCRVNGQTHCYLSIGNDYTNPKANIGVQLVNGKSEIILSANEYYFKDPDKLEYKTFAQYISEIVAELIPKQEEKEEEENS